MCLHLRTWRKFEVRRNPRYISAIRTLLRLHGTNDIGITCGFFRHCRIRGHGLNKTPAIRCCALPGLTFRCRISGCYTFFKTIQNR